MIKKIAIGIAAVIGLLMVGLVGSVVVDALVGPSAEAFTTTTFPGFDDEQVGAYVVEPEGDGPHPAVLMAHEWWGMNAEVNELADAMAEEGYLVMVVDTYRGKQTGIVPRALYLRLTVDAERVDADMMAAYEWLAARENVDAERIAAVGFCYGGGVVLRHATQNPDLAAVVDLYGTVITDPANLGAVADVPIPTMGIFGTEDMQFPPEEIEAFRQALETADVPHEVNVYAGMGHAFVQPDTITESGEAQSAWRDMLTFLEANL